MVSYYLQAQVFFNAERRAIKDVYSTCLIHREFVALWRLAAQQGAFQHAAIGMACHDQEYLWQGATLRSTSASAGRGVGGSRRRPEFLLLASECGEGIKNRHLFLQYNSTCTKIVIRNRAQPNKRVFWCTRSMLAPVAVLH